MPTAASYQGDSGFLRWWPRLLLGVAFVILVYGWSRSIQWAALFVVIAWLHGRWVPCRFTVSDDGIVLAFPFGGQRFLPKPRIRIRLEQTVAVATLKGRRFGYLLSDGVLYQPARAPRLRAAFLALDYDIT